MLNSIQEAIKDIKNGKLVIVVDDENRENEGDFVAGASKVTPEMINFMSKYGRGLICAPLTKKRCHELKLDLMTDGNTTLHETPFTIPVDLKGHGCTTGISAFDRAKTIQALIDPNTKPEELSKPGHIFPLKAQDGGVLRRPGHTEAAVDLARLAGLDPAGIIVEILHDDGTMAKLPELIKIAKKFNLKIITIESLIKYRLDNESLIKKINKVSMPTKHGNFELVSYEQIDTSEVHMALTKGTWKPDEIVLTRVHSSCVTGDIFGSSRCDCGEQLNRSIKIIEKEGKGVVLYIKQEGRGIGLIDKLKAYKLQEEGLDTAEANLKLGYKIDERDYGVGAQILRDLGINKMRLITNNPTKKTCLEGYGIKIVENIPIETKSNKHNKKYLKTKRDKMGHKILKDIK